MQRKHQQQIKKGQSVTNKDTAHYCQFICQYLLKDCLLMFILLNFIVMKSPCIVQICLHEQIYSDSCVINCNNLIIIKENYLSSSFPCFKRKITSLPLPPQVQQKVKILFYYDSLQFCCDQFTDWQKAFNQNIFS